MISYTADDQGSMVMAQLHFSSGYTTPVGRLPEGDTVLYRYMCYILQLARKTTARRRDILPIRTPPEECMYERRRCD